MQIGDASRGIACWLYTNKRYGDQCVQFIQGLMPLDHWTEQPLGVLADAPGGDVERVATSAEIAQVRQSAINDGLERAAKERAAIVAWLRAYKRDDTNWPQVLATAIETGEHLKASQAPGDAL